jgi:RND family efflux transporter MFP subunit
VRRVLIWLGVLVGLAGVAVGGWFVRQEALEEAAKEALGDKAIGHRAATVSVNGEQGITLKDPVAAGVRVESACDTMGSREELASGEVIVASGRSWDVRAPFAGTLKAGARELSVGFEVKAGEKLAVLAPHVSPDSRFDLQLRRRTADSDRESARAELELAKKELARTEDLATDGTVAKRALDESRTRTTRAQSTFDEAERRASSLVALEGRANFEELEIASPAAGVLARVETAPGSRVQPGDLLFGVESHAELRVRVDLAPGLASRAHPPERATLSFPALGGAERAGKLVSVDPHVRPGTLAVAAFYSVEDDGKLGLRPGEPVVARLAVGDEGHAVVVPASALLVRDGETWAYVFVSKTAYVRRKVTVLARGDADVLLAGGVAANESVVVAGAAVLLAEDLKPLIVVESEGGMRDEDDKKPAAEAKPTTEAKPAPASRKKKDDDDDDDDDRGKSPRKGGK